jgi:exonuclease VII small subunit
MSEHTLSDQSATNEHTFDDQSPTNERTLADRYETAMMKFQRYVKRAEDGTFRLEVEDGKSIGVDPGLFEVMKQSLEETNRKIKQGELKPEQVHYVNYADWERYRPKY